MLRFFALKNWRGHFKHDVADFLTEYMEAISDPDNTELFDYPEEKKNFERTFSILARVLGDKAFSRANTKTENELIRAFGIYHYEAFTIGIQPLLDAFDVETQDGIVKAREIMMLIKFDPVFIAHTTGGGKNSPGPLNDRVGFVKEKLVGAYDS